ncbi:MAG: POT family proton-dependent oligopeptide transporter [Francisella sp.]
MIFSGAKNSVDIKKASAYLVFLIIATVFWALYNQVFMSLNLFVDRVVDHNILGINIPTQSFLVFDTITVLIGGVILGIVWKKVALLDIYKYILGMFILVFMFVTVALGIYMSGIHSENLVSGYWVVLCYTCLGVAELLWRR